MSEEMTMKIKSICATVNQRLLSKANRLFTGSLQGRIIEILQNARRAGATRVEITNKDDMVSVQDNGSGIDDFMKLLDLGGSGWDDAFEASEDPAGVGIFCLAPREVTIRSKGRMVTIGGDGWTGAPVSILKDTGSTEGTVIRFRDEEWDESAVDLNAAFCGMRVIVDGHECPKLPFVSENGVSYAELGCRIEVCQSSDLNPWHHSSMGGRWYGNNVLINFHGQIVTFNHHPVSVHGLHFLIDMTGEPTGIRLMLPARTQLVENEALAALKDAMELEGFRYVQRQDHHTLSYKEYLQAKELGITLPEAKPTYSFGLLGADDPPDPVEVVKPKDFALNKCYRFDPNEKGGIENDEANVHLLAALGKFDDPFVPVSIPDRYNGYSWAKLPTIGKLEVSMDKELHSEWMWSGTLTCVESITITACASDGRVFSSKVCMAMAPAPPEKAPTWADDHLLLTPEAQERLYSTEIWHHLGGWNDEGDTYDTQEFQFQEELDRFWMQLVGPDEQLRRTIIRTLEGIQPAWKNVSISRDGTVCIKFEDGAAKQIAPPANPINDTPE
jgi:hypothetical protein